MPIDPASSNNVNDAIMRLYLYGEGADAITPQNGVSDFVIAKTIRPDTATTSFEVGAQTYKDGPGRFAMPELFEFVRLFFGGDLNEFFTGELDANGEIRIKKGNLINLYDKKLGRNQEENNSDDDYSYGLLVSS